MQRHVEMKSSGSSRCNPINQSEMTSRVLAKYLPR
jgi:hypothetical protein